MGKILYCFITGIGLFISFIKNKENMSENEAWEKALGNAGMGGVLNDWNQGMWGKISLEECEIWIKKKDRFKIQEEVDDTIAKQIIEEIKEIQKNENLQVNQVVILVHAVKGISISNAVNKTLQNKNIPVTWLHYTTDGGGKGAINVVKFVIQKIYEKNYKNICEELSKEIGEAKKKIELDHLIYSIATLFLPMDIDLIGICEVLAENYYLEIQFLYHLIYSIAPPFLPMDIDLIGICEVLAKRKKKAEEYYDKAFGTNSPKQKFEQKLNEAMDMVEKESNINDKIKKDIISELNKTKPDLPENFDINWFRNHSKNPEGNPFHQWFCKLIDSLEKKLK